MLSGCNKKVLHHVDDLTGKAREVYQSSFCLFYETVLRFFFSSCLMHNESFDSVLVISREYKALYVQEKEILE